MADASHQHFVVLEFTVGTQDDLAVIFQFGYSPSATNPPDPLHRSPTFVLPKQVAAELGARLIELAHALPDEPESDASSVH
jgi:hypothetical protein